MRGQYHHGLTNERTGNIMGSYCKIKISTFPLAQLRETLVLWRTWYLGTSDPCSHFCWTWGRIFHYVSGHRTPSTWGISWAGPVWSGQASSHWQDQLSVTTVMPDILCVFRLQVGNLKPHFLGPKWSELINLSAFQHEDFLGNPKLTLLLILEPFLRELWQF